MGPPNHPFKSIWMGFSLAKTILDFGMFPEITPSSTPSSLGTTGAAGGALVVVVVVTLLVGARAAVLSLYHKHMGGSIKVPQNGWFIRENPSINGYKWMIWRYPNLWKPLHLVCSWEQHQAKWGIVHCWLREDTHHSKPKGCFSRGLLFNEVTLTSSHS